MKDVRTLGTILGIWAHPDDEAWSMAGLMKRAVDNGRTVHLVTATRGEAGNIEGSDECDRQNLAELREQEMRDSLACIGEIKHQWLDYQDGKMIDANEDDAVSKLVDIITALNPDTIVTFEPNGITGHDDHRTISRWTTLAVSRAGSRATVLHATESKQRYDDVGKEMDKKFNIYFNTDKPVLVDEHDADVLIALSDAELECKLACLRAHSSQTSHMFEDPDLSHYVEPMACSEVFVVSTGA